MFMKKLDTTPKMFTKEKANETAKVMKASDPEWDYVAVHDPKGTGWSFIEVYDEDGEFVSKV